jgi:branched-subunit amino acid ABC-type transport system permease component
LELLQLAINGVALGAAYALVALGFVLVLNATSAVNFAQGDLVVAGGFLAVAVAGLIPLPGILWLTGRCVTAHRSPSSSAPSRSASSSRMD